MKKISAILLVAAGFAIAFTGCSKKSEKAASATGKK